MQHIWYSDVQWCSTYDSLKCIHMQHLWYSDAALMIQWCTVMQHRWFTKMHSYAAHMIQWCTVMQHIWFTKMHSYAAHMITVMYSDAAYMIQWCTVMQHLWYSDVQWGSTYDSLKCIPSLSFFSSPEPKAHRWAYSIGRHPSSICSSVHPSSVNIFKRLLLWAVKPFLSSSHIASIGRGNK